MKIELTTQFPNLYSYDAEGNMIWFVKGLNSKKTGYTAVCIKASPMSGYKVGDINRNLDVAGMVVVDRFVVPHQADAIPHCYAKDDYFAWMIVKKQATGYPSYVGVCIKSRSQLGYKCGDISTGVNTAGMIPIDVEFINVWQQGSLNASSVVIPQEGVMHKKKPVKTKPIFEPLGTIVVPANNEQFVAKEKFVVDTSLADIIHEGSESRCDSSNESMLGDGVLPQRRFHGL